MEARKIFNNLITDDKRLLVILAASISFILYLITMPLTVQEGDTAELVLAGNFLSLAHPPGYPLQTIWNFTVIKLFNFLTPYQASSLGSIIISSFTVALIANFIKGWRGFLAATLWSTSFLAWKWAILPDVFAGLMLFAILFFQLLQKPQLINSPFSLLLAISVLHHHLIIFLFPILVFSWWPFRQNLNNNIKLLLYGALSFSGYGILLVLDDTRPGSWGTVDSLSELINHFLRKDYGTTSLSAHSRGSPYQHNTLQFLVTWFESFWSLFLLLPLILKNLNKKHFVLVVCFCLYFSVVILNSGLDVDSFGISTLERFFLLPCLIILLICFTTANLAQHQRLVSLILFLNIISNLYFNFSRNNYRSNTLIHDWAMTAFKQTPLNALLWVSGDTETNAIRYLHEIEEHRSDLVIMSNLDLSEKDFRKVEIKYPFVFKLGQTWNEKINWDKVEFYSNELNIPGSQNLDKDVLGILVRYKPGNGTIHFNCANKESFHFTSNLDPRFAAEPKIGSALVMSYTACHLNAVNEAIGKNNFLYAEELALKGLAVIPTHPVLQVQLCLVQKRLNKNVSECEQRASELLTNTHEVYLPPSFRIK